MSDKNLTAYVLLQLTMVAAATGNFQLLNMLTASTPHKGKSPRLRHGNDPHRPNTRALNAANNRTTFSRG